MFNDEERKPLLECESKEVMEYTGKNQMNVHVHVYHTLTDCADCHQHVVLGVSGPASMVGRSHVHPMRTRTSFVEGHWHWVEIMTDRALIMPDDTHTHYFAGRTSMDDGHCHEFSDITNLIADLCVEVDEDECPPTVKPCKYKYNRPEEDEYN